MPEHQQIQQSKKPDTYFQKQATPVIQTPLSNPYSIIQRAKINPKSLTHADVMQLQRTIGNQAVDRLLSGIGSTSTAQQATVQRQEIPEEKGEETCPSCMQRQENPEEKEPLQGKFEDKPEIVCPSCFAAPIVQKQESEEKEKPLQDKMIGTIQRQEIPKEEPLQTKRENNTGMPDNLKAGVENLSGIDMSDVRVHYNSDKPSEVGALAYTQGTNIHVASGQERHLPHEAWHVVQQAQGRVRPTVQMRGMVVNDNEELEHEADLMGGKAVQMQVGGCQECRPDNLIFAEVPEKDSDKTHQRLTTDLAPIPSTGLEKKTDVRGHKAIKLEIDRSTNNIQREASKTQDTYLIQRFDAIQKMTNKNIIQTNNTIQLKWLHGGGADFYWDKIIDGLQWYFFPENDSFVYKVVNISDIPEAYRESIRASEGCPLTEAQLDDMGFAEIEADSSVEVDTSGGFIERANAKSAGRDPKQNGHIMNYAEVLRTTLVEDEEWVKIDAFETDSQYSGSRPDHLHSAGINQIHNSECADPKVQDQVELGIQELRQDGLRDEIDVFHYDDEEPCDTACATNIEQQAVRLGAEIHLYLSDRKNAQGKYEGAVPVRTYDKSAKTQTLKRRGGATGIEQVSSEINDQLTSLQNQLSAINLSIKTKTETVPAEHLEKALGQLKKKKIKLERMIRALNNRLHQLQMMTDQLRSIGQA